MNNIHDILFDKFNNLSLEDSIKYKQLMTIDDNVKLYCSKLDFDLCHFVPNNDLTSNSFMFDTKIYYVYSLIEKIDVEIIHNYIIKNKITKFLSVVETFLFLIDSKILKKLPTFSMFIDNDEDVIIRWAYKGIDIIFNFSKIKNQTFWIFTRKIDNEINSESGSLNSKIIFRKLVEAYYYMLSYV